MKFNDEPFPIDLKPSSMPDLGISLDKVFYPGFDIL